MSLNSCTSISKKFCVASNLKLSIVPTKIPLGNIAERPEVTIVSPFTNLAFFCISVSCTKCGDFAFQLKVPN